MSQIKIVWNNFKAQPEIWFFYGFLATCSLSVRKVLVDYPISGSFNEYTGSYVYLSDFFLLTTLIFWLITILKNKRTNLSIAETSAVPCGTFPFCLLVLLLFLGWMLISAGWAEKAEIGYFKFFKIFEFSGLFLFLAFNRAFFFREKMFHVEHSTRQSWNFLKNLFIIIIVIGLINAIIGILQFILQHSLGLSWLRESLITPDLPGVAKIVFGGAKYIRAYGLFPHPNILGGFMLLTIIITLAYWRLFHAEKSKPKCAARCADWDNGKCKVYTLPKKFFSNPACSTWNNCHRTTHLFFRLVLAVQIVGIMLTFSKSAILGTILSLIYMFHAEHIVISHKRKLKILCLAAVALGLVVYLARPDFYSFFVKSLAERLLYINISLGMISANFLAGIGSGQFVVEMQKYSSQALFAWQFQPVHNVFLLILSELGLIGFFLFIIFVRKLLYVEQSKEEAKIKCSTWNNQGCEVYSKLPVTAVSRGTIEHFLNLQIACKALLIGFFLISLFDHYLWDIQQGQIMLWMTLGLLAGSRPSKLIT